MNKYSISRNNLHPIQSQSSCGSHSFKITHKSKVSLVKSRKQRYITVIISLLLIQKTVHSKVYKHSTILTTGGGQTGWGTKPDGGAMSKGAVDADAAADNEGMGNGGGWCVTKPATGWAPSEGTGAADDRVNEERTCGWGCRLWAVKTVTGWAPSDGIVEVKGTEGTCCWGGKCVMKPVASWAPSKGTVAVKDDVCDEATVAAAWETTGQNFPRMWGSDTTGGRRFAAPLPGLAGAGDKTLGAPTSVPSKIQS